MNTPSFGPPWPSSHRERCLHCRKAPEFHNNDKAMSCLFDSTTYQRMTHREYNDRYGAIPAFPATTSEIP